MVDAIMARATKRNGIAPCMVMGAAIRSRLNMRQLARSVFRQTQHAGKCSESRGIRLTHRHIGKRNHTQISEKCYAGRMGCQNSIRATHLPIGRIMGHQSLMGDSDLRLRRFCVFVPSCLSSLMATFRPCSTKRFGNTLSRLKHMAVPFEIWHTDQYAIVPSFRHP